MGVQGECGWGWGCGWRNRDNEARDDEGESGVVEEDSGVWGGEAARGWGSLNASVNGSESAKGVVVQVVVDLRVVEEHALQFVCLSNF